MEKHEFDEFKEQIETLRAENRAIGSALTARLSIIGFLLFDILLVLAYIAYKLT